MASHAASLVWNPSLGIRFSSIPNRTPCYPLLDVRRFLHVAIAGSQSEDGRGRVADELLAARSSKNYVPKEQSFLEQAASLAGQATPSTDALKGMGQDDDMRGIPTQNQGKTPESAEPPRTNLSLNISADLFHAARAARVGTPESFWSHTMYQRITEAGVVEDVTVHYCRDKKSMENICKEHFLGQEVLGFDLEWSAFATASSGPRENVSLIQLASPTRIGLFHVAIFADDDFIAPTFRQIMEDPRVSKVGVHIQADCTRLNNHLGVKTQGVFELSHLYKLVKYLTAGLPRLVNKSLVSLSTQAHECLKLPLYKGVSVRRSNWMRPLDSRQLVYSASDAYAGIQIYHILEAKRKALKPPPPRPHYAELGLPIAIAAPDPGDGSGHQDAPAGVVGESDAPQPIPRPARATPRRRKLPDSQTPAAKPRDARIVAAELVATQYRSSRLRPVAATPSALRAYFLWHSNVELKPESIAKLLREPPLQTHTIITYILDAIAAEKLPYDKARLKSEIMSFLHPSSANGRYRTLAKDCEGVELPENTS